MITFENTQIAFDIKTNKELKKAYFLFKTMSKAWIVKTGKVLLQLASFLHIPINWAVKPTIYSHFVGGETLEDCENVVENLARYNVKSILDFSVEGKESPEDIEKALQETLKSIQNAGRNPNIPFAVFKPTAFVRHKILEIVSAAKDLSSLEQKEFDAFVQRIELLCRTAFENHVPILIDAEDFAFQKAIDEVVTKMMEKFNSEKAIVFNTLQMYRHDRLEFLEKAYKKAVEGNYYLGIKFVRGAYMERERERAKKMNYPSPIYPDKESTDKGYNAGLKFTIDHIDRISVFNGTHNEFSSKYLADLMQEKGIDKNDSRIYFSQLYGMSDHISFNLAKEGFNVAKYVPYGPVKFVMPYLIRRAEENTSIAGQTSRELMLITKELNRRKSNHHVN